MNKTIMVLLKVILGLWVTTKPEFNERRPSYMDLTNKYLELIRTVTGALGLGSESEVINNLKETIQWLQITEHDVPFMEVTARVRMDLGDYTHYIDSFKEYAELEYGPLLNHAQYELNTEINKKELGSVLNKASYAMNNKNEMDLDMSKFLTTHMESIQNFQAKFTSGSNLLDSAVGSVNPGSIEKALENAVKKTASQFRLLTPFKGVNEMLGNGIPFPAYINTTALTGNYKTGTLVDFFLGAALLNKPMLKDPNKKPLLLRISLETEVEADTLQIYNRAFSMEYGKEVKPEELDPIKAKEYLDERFSKNGWHWGLHYYAPGTFGEQDLYRLIQLYEEQGYELLVLNLDYAFLMVEDGDSLVTSTERLVERIRGFCCMRNCIFMSAHQFNSEAKNQKPEKGVRFVEAALSGGNFMQCKTLDTKMDISLGCDIHRNNGRSYMVFTCAKNRSIQALKKTYCIYEFDPISGLPFDALDPVSKEIGTYNDLQQYINELSAKEYENV